MAAKNESLRVPLPVPPPPGKTVEIAPGVHWLVTSLPFRLNAVNLWLLREDETCCEYEGEQNEE